MFVVDMLSEHYLIYVSVQNPLFLVLHVQLGGKCPASPRKRNDLCSTSREMWKRL